MPRRIAICAAAMLAIAARAQESDAEKAARLITGGSQQPARRPPSTAKPKADAPAPAAPKTPAAAPTAATAPPTPTAAGKPRYYVMKRFTLMDEHGFERPIPALTLLLPTDWKFQGEIKYGQGGGCTANMVQGGFRAESADGRVALEMFPGYNWQWSDDPGMRQAMQASSQQMAQFGQRGCDISPPMAAGDFLRRFVLPKFRANAQVAGVEPLPQVIQQLQQQARQTEAGYAQAGLRAQVRSDAARARLQYTHNGQPVEEWVTAVTVATGTLGPSYNMATGQMGQSFFYNCSGMLTFGERTVAGQLQPSEKFFEMVLATMQLDQNWLNRITQVASNISAAQIKGARDRSAIITKNNEEISNIINQGYQDRQKSQDRMAQNWSQTMRGVESYRNPNTGEVVELSNSYGNAWVNNRGEYLLTDQSGFDPNVELHQQWTRLQQVKQ